MTKPAPDVGETPTLVQACRPEDRAILQTEAGRHMLECAVEHLRNQPGDTKPCDDRATACPEYPDCHCGRAWKKHEADMRVTERTKPDVGETPRTDKALRNTQGMFRAAAAANGFADFARQLERELSQARAALDAALGPVSYGKQSKW